MLRQFNRIRCIFFDLDNTLINRDYAFFLYLEKAFQMAGKSDIWMANCEEIMRIDNHGFLSRKAFDECLCASYIDADSYREFQGRYLVGDFVSLASHSTRSLLEKLKNNYTLGILSNGGTGNQTKKLAHSGLDAYFDESMCFISQACGVSKPDAGIFEIAQMKSGCRAEELLMIGDNPVNDIRGAKALGWKTAWLSEQEDALAEADIKIRKLEDLNI